MSNELSLNVLSPCKGCEERELHCHSKCERYKAYKDEIEWRRTAEIAANDEIAFATQVKHEVAKRYYKRKREGRK